jgi:hypothetical protein
MYHRFMCMKQITIEGQKNGSTLRSFQFVGTPISTPGSSIPPFSPSPARPNPRLGTIHFDVYNSEDAEPYEANTNNEIPEINLLNPDLPRKSLAIGTGLGEVKENNLEKRVLTITCGKNIIESHTFHVRPPLEMLVRELMKRCWENWWEQERIMFRK